MHMGRNQWIVAQGLAVITFLVLWLLGLMVLGAIFSRSTPAPSQATTPCPTPSPTPSVTATSTPRPTATSTPRPTCTRKPTRTPRPTYTPSPSPTPSPSSTPAPAANPDADTLPTFLPPATPIPDQPTPAFSTPIPTPVPLVTAAPDVINIVVLGSDRRPDWSEWHTDAIHVVSIQTNDATVSILSIPRDLYVYIPGFWMSRINFADFYGEAYGYPGGGTALLRDTFRYNLGIWVDHTVRTDFDGLIGIVDTLGGVDIPVHCSLSDHWPYPDENGEYPTLTLEPGIHHMDGETALWYARSRQTTSVFSRDRRQQQVLQAIWRKMRDEGMLSQIPTLWEQSRDMLVTDLGFDDVLQLAPAAFSLKEQNVRFYSIGPGEVTSWTTPKGGVVFLPDWEAIEPIVAEAMAPLPQARLNRTFTPVEVWNGTPNSDWGLLASDRLARAGFPATIGEPDRREYAETQLTVFSEYAKGTGVGHLQQMFGVPDGRVAYEPDWDTAFGFRLIIGTDYQTCYER